MNILLLSLAIACWVAAPIVTYRAARTIYDPGRNIESVSPKFASSISFFPGNALLFLGLLPAYLSGMDPAIIVICMITTLSVAIYTLGKGAIRGRATNN